MDDDQREQPETGGDLDVEDLDVDEPDAEAVKGGSGGQFDQKGNIKF